MEQIPGNDAIFLALDTPSSLAQIGGIAVLDPKDAPGFGFERFRQVLGERIRQAPRFVCKVREVPLGLGLPFWVEDADFELDNHLHRIALPSPGGTRELCEVVSHLFSRPLDRRLPLWEVWFIEGLENDRVATFQMNHHCMIDGASGRGLMELLYDVEPSPPPRAKLPPKPRKRVGGEPSDLELLVRGLGTTFLTPFRLARYAGQAAARGLVMFRESRVKDEHGEEGAALVADVPRVSFNARTHQRREFACTTVPLSTVRDLKKHFGVKVNDVVLALTSSAVRRYLASQDELPNQSLLATVPVSTRGDGPDDAANSIANMIVTLATDLEDPVERLMQIHRSSMRSKEMTRAVRAREIQAMGDTAPPALLNLAFRLATTTLLDAMPLPANLTVSNVPGPPMRLYIAGAKLEATYPISMAMGGQGLNVTVMSYMDRVDFGFTVDPDLVRDPWYLADGVAPALDELVAATSRPA